MQEQQNISQGSSSATVHLFGPAWRREENLRAVRMSYFLSAVDTSTIHKGDFQGA